MDSDIKQKLLPLKPPTPPREKSAQNVLNSGLRPPLPPQMTRQVTQKPGNDFALLKKRGHGLRSWISIDQKGNCKSLEADKLTIMRRYWLYEFSSQ